MANTKLHQAVATRGNVLVVSATTVKVINIMNWDQKISNVLAEKMLCYTMNKTAANLLETNFVQHRTSMFWEHPSPLRYCFCSRATKPLINVMSPALATKTNRNSWILWLHRIQCELIHSYPQRYNIFNKIYELIHFQERASTTHQSWCLKKAALKLVEQFTL